MKRFSQLIEELDRTTSTLKKVDALRSLGKREFNARYESAARAD